MAYDALDLKKKFQLFNGGMNTKEQPQNLLDTESPSLVNIQPFGKSAYGPRYGITQVGSDQTGTGVIRSLYTFTKLTAAILIRSRTTVLEYLKTSNNTWTSVPGISAYTSDQEFGFANDNRFVYFGNGVDNFGVWDGKNLTATFTADAGTDVFTSAAHGLTDGNIVYVSNSGGALPTGLSAATPYYVVTAATNTFQLSATLGGSAINISDAGTGTQTFASGIREYSGNQKGNIFTFFIKRLCIAGIATAPTTVYYSKTGTPTDFTFSTPRVADDGGFFQVGEGGDPITSLVAYTQPGGTAAILLVFKKSERIYQVTFTADGTPDIQEAKTGTGAVNHRSTIQMENDVIYVNPGNSIENLGFRANFQNQLRSDSSSYAIDNSALSLTFTRACAIYNPKRKFALYAAQEYGSTVNNVVYAFFYEHQSWWKWTGINANQFAMYNGNIVWASSVDMNVYQYDETRFDDLDVGPILSERYTRDMEGENAQGSQGDRYKQARFAIVRGYVSTSCDRFEIPVFYDGNTDTEIESYFDATGDSDVVQSSGDTHIAFGEKVFGETIFGGGGVQSPTNFPMREFLAVVSLDTYSHLRARVGTRVNGAGMPYVVTFISFWSGLMEEEKLLSGSKI